MAIFDFTGTNGTTLAAYDARFDGATTLLNIQSNALVATAAFGGGRFWFVNGQGADQSVEATFDQIAGSDTTRFTLQTNATQVGYEFQIRTDGDIDFTRNGSFIQRFTGGGAISGSILVKATIVAGLITVFTNGVSRGTYTDGTPLTGGYPGALLIPAATVTAPSLLDWTDLGANAYTLTADTSTYSITGQDATLVKTGSVNYTLTAETGSYAVIGSNVFVDFAFPANTGLYTITGQAATLTYNSVGGSTNYSLTADVGTYSISGQTANLLYVGGPVVYSMIASPGLYTIFGRAANVVWSGAPVVQGGDLRRRLGIKMSMGI